MSESIQGTNAPWTADQDLVVKLQVKGGESVRRIHANRLRNKEGLICYNRLIRWALRYSPMAAKDPIFVARWESDWKSLRESYNVLTFYKDEDGDEIRFSSNLEFIEAVQIFAKHKLEDDDSIISGLEGAKPVVFRCLVDFEEKTKKNPKNEAKAAVPNEKPEEESSEALKAQKEAQIHQAFESFVSILAGALVALQGSLAVASANVKKAEEGLTSRVRRGMEENDKEGESSEVKALVDRLLQRVAGRRDEASGPSQPGSESNRAAEGAERAREAVERMMNEILGALEIRPKSPDTEGKDPLAGFDKTFVHARHTCDGCHKSPIVGIRYHAVNIPDFDYCADCKENYAGMSINFAPEQLARDNKFQPKLRCGMGGRPRPFSARLGRNGHGPCGNGRHNRFPGEHRRRMQHMNEEDALKEAIRRSLAEESAKNEVEEKKQEAPTEPKKEEAAAAVAVETKDEAEMNKELTPQLVLSQAADAQKEDLAKVTQIVDAVGMTVGQCAIIVGSVISDMVDSKSSDGASTVSSLSQSKVTDLELVEAKETASKEVVAVVPEPIASEASVADEAAVQDVPRSFNAALESSVDQETFLVDDNGNEVASFSSAVEKETLVETAEDDVKEAVATPLEVASIAEQEVEEPIVAKEEPALQKQEAVEEAIIVPTDESVGSDEEWDVLDDGDDDDDNNNNMASSFAKIADTMHSQDLTRSQEELASIDKAQDNEDDDASIVSGVSSVESFDSKFSVSSDDSPVSSILVARWDEELAILRGLGFTDDKKSLNALETLEAANIGVNCDDDISINAVVNFLLNQRD